MLTGDYSKQDLEGQVSCIVATQTLHDYERDWPKGFVRLSEMEWGDLGRTDDRIHDVTERRVNV